MTTSLKDKAGAEDSVSAGAPPHSGLLRAGAMMLTGTVVSRALGFLYPVVLSRTLTTHDFALVMFAIASSFVAAQAAVSGIPIALTRLIAADDSPDRRGAWLTLGALATGLMLFVSMIASGTLSALASQPIPFGALIVFGLTADALYFAVLQGLRRFRLMAVYRSGANLIQLFGIFALAGVARVTPMWAVGIYAFSYFLPMFLLELRCRTLRSRIRFRWSLPPRGHPDYSILTALSRPALGTALCYSAIVGADVFFVQRLSHAAFPAYSAGRSIALMMTFVPFSLGMVVMPRIAGLHARKAIPELKRALLIAAAASLIVGGGLFAVAPAAVAIAFPQKFHAAATSIRWLIPGFAALGTFSIFSQWWMGIGRPQMPARVLFSAGLISLAVYPVFIARWGTAGAGLALMIAAVWAVALMSILTHRLLLSPAESQGSDH